MIYGINYAIEYKIALFAIRQETYTDLSSAGDYNKYEHYF